MKEDEFTKLFKYMIERFDKIYQTLDSKASEIDMKKVLNIFG